MSINFNSTKAQTKDGHLHTKYTYENSIVEKDASGNFNVTPTAVNYEFKLDLKVPKVGLLLVGIGGNNGTTVLGATLANKHKISFETKEGVVKPNYYGSVTQSSTVKIGVDKETGDDVYVPFKSLVPMVDPNDLVIDGWDISGVTLDQAMKRAKVLDVTLQKQLYPYLENKKPMSSIYYPDFIAMNQSGRADNVYNSVNGEVKTDQKWQDVEKIRKDIRDFKEKHALDTVVVLWSANTERNADIIPGVNDTADNLIKSIKENHHEISPLAIFGVASALEGSTFINGSPSILVPGLVDFCESRATFLGGSDFKSGQTKLKSVLGQFLVDAGIKPLSIASYNHLGNNDGFNLSAPQQFRSKEISKRGVLDDIIESNSILYNKEDGDHVDHCVVIKYLPAVGDDKVAIDEYYSSLCLGGKNRITLSTICEDSLLATPLILDLVIVGELLQRIQYKVDGDEKFQDLHSVLSLLSYWLKAPIAKSGYKAVNGLNKQRSALINLLLILNGVSPTNDLRLQEVTQ
ncbi:Inositol-3-phosphate synthase [Candida tropicalis]